MPNLQWTPQGRQDVDNVYDYIARRDRRPAIADRVVENLIASCESLAAAFAFGSILGTSRPEFGESARLFTHKRWVIVFRPVDKGIEVLRVLDGSRDFSRIFTE